MTWMIEQKIETGRTLDELESLTPGFAGQGHHLAASPGGKTSGGALHGVATRNTRRGLVQRCTGLGLQLRDRMVVPSAEFRTEPIRNTGRSCGLPAPFPLDSRTRRQPARFPTRRRRSMTLVVVLLVGVVAFLTLLVFGLLKSHAEIIRALSRAGITLDDGPAPSGHPDRAGASGAPLPSGVGGIHDIVGVSPGGGPIKVNVTGVDGLILLAFLSSGCRTCEKFWKAFAESDLQLPHPRVRLVIVGQDPIYESESSVRRVGTTGGQSGAVQHRVAGLRGPRIALLHAGRRRGRSAARGGHSR